jgi:CheY-like chemotaxis protein
VTRSFGAREREEVRRALEHDLKTPLSVIAGYAELLRDRDDEQLRREAVERILLGVARLRAELDALARRIDLAPLTENGHGTPRKILLVDDDDDVRRLLQVTVAQQNHTLLEAADGGRALELAREHAPELVVLDWHLPGRSGQEVLASLKSWPASPRVLVLTAHAEAAGHASEADAFLTKPFSPLELLAEIDRLLTD